MQLGGRILLLFSVVALADGTGAKRGSVSPLLPEVWNDIALEYLDREGTRTSGCKDCQGVRQVLEEQYPEFNLTQIRLEMFKAELLRRLGMSAPPTHRFSSLPGPVAQGDVFKGHDQETKAPEQTNSTERVVVMAADLKCSLVNQGMQLQFRMDMPDQAVQGDEILSGRLWLYTEPIFFESGIITTKPCDSQDTNLLKKLDLQQSETKGDWLESDITWIIQEKESCFMFTVIMQTANSENINCSLFQDTTKKPLLIADVRTDEPVESSRDKRNVNCVEGLTECCREKLFLSFSEIGWGDWIIQPRGYDAYYCKGTCANAASISLSATPYHSVIKKLYLSEANKFHFTPCCTPIRLSPVQLIYMDNNKTLVQKTIPNLTVEACGCM